MWWEQKGIVKLYEMPERKAYLRVIICINERKSIFSNANELIFQPDTDFRNGERLIRAQSRKLRT